MYRRTVQMKQNIMTFIYSTNEAEHYYMYRRTVQMKHNIMTFIDSTNEAEHYYMYRQYKRSRTLLHV